MTGIKSQTVSKSRSRYAILERLGLVSVSRKCRKVSVSVSSRTDKKFIRRWDSELRTWTFYDNIVLQVQ